VKAVHNLSKKRVLVTGASGFIGSHLCKRLLSLGCEVHALSRSKRPSEEKAIQWWQADLSDPSKVLETAKSINSDLVFHLSSLVTGSRSLEAVLPTFQANLASTVNLLVALSTIGCQRVLMIGSMEESHPNMPLSSSISPYAASKSSCSIYGRLFHSLYHLPVVIAHLFMVYGPGQLDLNKLIPYATISLLKNEAPKIGSGSRKVDWIYVDDVVDALTACAEAEGIEGQTVEVGYGELITIREVVEDIADIIRSKVKPVFGAIEDRPYENVRVADRDKSYEMLGWRASVPLREGLKRTVDWYKEQMISGASKN
jgi:nucleoside-diphosphate-sugar epimerase